MSVTIIQARADELLNGGFIASGGHSEESGQRCIQEWCSYIAGEPHGGGWSWNASHDARRTRDSKVAPQLMERSSAGLRYPFSSKWAATASVGARSASLTGLVR